MRIKYWKSLAAAQRAHYRLIAYYGLSASSLFVGPVTVEQRIFVKPGTLRIQIN